MGEYGGYGKSECGHGESNDYGGDFSDGLDEGGDFGESGSYDSDAAYDGGTAEGFSDA